MLHTTQQHDGTSVGRATGGALLFAIVWMGAANEAAAGCGAYLWQRDANGRLMRIQHGDVAQELPSETPVGSFRNDPDQPSKPSCAGLECSGNVPAQSLPPPNTIGKPTFEAAYLPPTSTVDRNDYLAAGLAESLFIPPAPLARVFRPPRTT